MMYLQGRSNLACTVFTPVDCTNNCEFCTTKELYKKNPYSPENLVKICKTIVTLTNKCNSIREYVVTGGEPSNDLVSLRMMIGCMNKPVFINTCFQDSEQRNEFVQLVNSEPKIAGVNISRHLRDVQCRTTDWIEEDIAAMDMINKPVRVNCIVSEEDIPNNDVCGIKCSIGRLFNTYASVDPYRMVNFRADYRGITIDNLKTIDPMSKFFLEYMIYTGSNSCLVCNSMFFKSLDDRQMCWHRGLPHSSAIYNEFCYVNDVIISPDGEIYRDWDMKEDKDFTQSLIDEANCEDGLL